MGDQPTKSHGVDLRFSTQRNFSRYFSVNIEETPEFFLSKPQPGQLPGQPRVTTVERTPEFYLTHPNMSEEELFGVLTQKKLNPRAQYYHPTLSRAFQGEEFVKAYREVIEDYTKNFSDGLIKLVCENFNLGDIIVDITEVTGLSIRMNLGNRVAVLDFSEHWGKFLDRNLAQGISLRRIIVALQKEKDPNKALRLLENTDEFQNWLKNHPQHTTIANMSPEAQVKRFLQDYLNSTLPKYIQDFILEKLNKDLLFNQRTVTDITQIFSHSNVTPFVLRIEFTKIGTLGFLQHKNYVDIPNTDFESLRITPLSEKVTELFRPDQIASMSQVACYVMAWLLTEYRVAKKLNKPFANKEALRFLEALNELYELHKQLAELGPQNLPQGQQGFNLTEEHTKNVFVWLRHLLLYDVSGSGEVASSRQEFREDLVRNFLRLYTPGYILERGQDQYLAVSLGVQHQGMQDVTVLFQRDVEEDELVGLVRDRILSLGQQALQDNSVRGDILFAVRHGSLSSGSPAGLSLNIYGAKLEGNKSETIIRLLELQGLLNWRLEGSLIEQLKAVDQETLEKSRYQVSNPTVNQIFNSLPQNVQRAYNRIRINLGQGNLPFKDFIQQGANLANDEKRIRDLISSGIIRSPTPSNPSDLLLSELIQPSQDTSAALRGPIIYDPLTGFRLRQ